MTTEEKETELSTIFWTQNSTLVGTLLTKVSLYTYYPFFINKMYTTGI